MAKQPAPGGGNAPPATALHEPHQPHANGLYVLPVWTQRFNADEGYEGLWADFRCNISLFDIDKVGNDLWQSLPAFIVDWNIADVEDHTQKLEISPEGLRKVPAKLAGQMFRFWYREICEVPPADAGASSTDSPAETPTDPTSTNN